MLGQKDGCGADHDTELQRVAALDLWQGGLGHNPLQRGAAPDLLQELIGHNPLQYCETSACAWLLRPERAWAQKQAPLYIYPDLYIYIYIYKALPGQDAPAKNIEANLGSGCPHTGGVRELGYIRVCSCVPGFTRARH